jgi:hypothetical protein
MRKNKNRGFQKLRVWQDAIEYYKHTCNIFRNFPYMVSNNPTLHYSISPLNVINTWIFSNNFFDKLFERKLFG